VITDNIIRWNVVSGIAMDFNPDCLPKVSSNTVVLNMYGISVGVASNASVVDNLVARNSGGAIRMEGGGIVRGNTVAGNEGFGVRLSSGTLERNAVSGNTCSTSNTGAIAIGPVHPDRPLSLRLNSLRNNVPFEMSVDDNTYGTSLIDATDNWWGTTESQEIAAHIYDWNDNILLQRVDFEPFLTEPDPSAPPLPPESLQLTPIERGLELSWLPNAESDILGYRIYWTDQDDLLYPGAEGIRSADVGNQTHITLSPLATDGPLLVAVTAYDSQGYESWYSNIETAQALSIPTAPPDYYDSVDTTSAATLRATLHDLIDDHTRFPYTSMATDTWDILETADADPNNPANILDVYRNASYLKHGGGVGVYNREHTWPKSYGFPIKNAGNYPYTDCHQLFLCDSGYNTVRSNKPYRYCAPEREEWETESNNGQGGGSGTYPGNSNWTSGSYTAGTWETWNGRRGDVARALFYMDVRYEGGTHGVTGAIEPDLVLTDNEATIENSNTGENESAGYMGMLSVLLQWHLEDPVDALEQHRNDVIYSHQDNRNPFIDHPEWVELVFTQATSLTQIAIQLVDNWNIIALVLEPLEAFTASILAMDITDQGGSISQVFWWDAVAGSWDFWLVDVGYGTDFPIEMGEGYLLKSTGAATWTYWGACPSLE